MTAAYLTTGAGARALGIEADALQRLIDDGELPVVKRTGDEPLIPGPAFDAYVRRLNGQTATPLGRAIFQQ